MEKNRAPRDSDSIQWKAFRAMPLGQGVASTNASRIQTTFVREDGPPGAGRVKGCRRGGRGTPNKCLL